MFVVTLTYEVPLEAVEKALADHIAWLEKYYAEGTFIASGRRNPRVGGVIMAQAQNEDALRKIMDEDPFAVRKLARANIVEVTISKARDGLEGLIGL